MSRKAIVSFFVCIAALTVSTGLRADGGTQGSFTPYSMFGVGDIAMPGSSYNRQMAGVGVASRNNRFLNITNPASVTARDSLSFMADFSLSGACTLFNQGDMKSVSNTFNLSSLAISFPLGNHMAMMVGIAPYSNMGYNYGYYLSDPAVISQTGVVGFSATGQGSVYQAFAGIGATLWKRLSLGVQGNFSFGNLEKNYTQTFSDASYQGYEKGYVISLTGTNLKFGIQYDQPLGSKSSLTLGATYSLATNLRAYVNDVYQNKTDTLDRSSGLRLASELSVGLAYNYGDKLKIECDASFSDWNNTGMMSHNAFKGEKFTTTSQKSYRLGAEFVPNRNDVRYYFKKCTYRAGVYRKNEYYLLDGNEVNSTAVTFGMTLPVFRWYNGLSVGMEIGRRGSVANNMIRETFFNFSFGMNIFDIWFQQPRYD